MAVQPTLRPMSLGEILDRTFEMYRRRFLLFAGIAAVPASAMFGVHCADLMWWHLQSLVQPYRQPGIFLWNLALGLGFYHIWGLLANLFLPAFVLACSNVLFGESISVLSSLRFAVARWRTYLWIAVLKMCAVLLIPEILAGTVMLGCVFLLDKMGMLDGSSIAPAGGVVFLLLLGAFALFLWGEACLAFAIPAAALEGQSGLNALRRSWVLSRHGRLRLVVPWVLVWIFGSVLNTTTAFLARWIAILLYRGHHFAGFNNNVFLAVVYFLYAATAIVLAPLYPIAVTLLYYDQRVRKEGYDLEKMLEAAGGSAPVVAGATSGLAARLENQ
jgi:hypothetical protein